LPVESTYGNEPTAAEALAETLNMKWEAVSRCHGWSYVGSQTNVGSGALQAAHGVLNRSRLIQSVSIFN
jgi:hypothetical protein